MRDDFDKAAAWGKTHNRPIFLGEFGAFSAADMDSRARWTAAVVREATARGFASPTGSSAPASASTTSATKNGVIRCCNRS